MGQIDVKQLQMTQWDKLISCEAAFFEIQLFLNMNLFLLSLIDKCPSVPPYTSVNRFQHALSFVSHLVEISLLGDQPNCGYRIFCCPCERVYCIYFYSVLFRINEHQNFSYITSSLCQWYKVRPQKPLKLANSCQNHNSLFKCLIYIKFLLK